MTSVAVVHAKFDTLGGAEVVCAHTLELLQSEFDHDVTLFSFDEPDFEALNRFCDTAVSPVPVRRPDRIGPPFNAALLACNRVTGGRCGAHVKLKAALLNRFVRRRTRESDLRVSTSNELALPSPSVQYVHFPQFNNRLHDGDSGATGPVSELYDWLCTRAAGVSSARLADASLLTNSAWTADVFEDQYDLRPSVLHPPVRTEVFRDRSLPWAEREPGFVLSGRIAPDKRILEVIDVVEGVRGQGHDVHLHVVGPTTARNESYRTRVRRAASARDYVHFEGELPRSELVSLVCRHRYGIHGKPNEHFGLSVAELVAGGTIPFVPDGGGQVDVVDGRDELVYSTADDAVEKIETVLETPDLQSRLRAALDTRAAEFGVKPFRRGMCQAIERGLESRRAR